MSKIVQPAGWPRPRGYSNGVVAEGRLLFIAGQIGWNERNEFSSSDLVQQTAQALRNVVAVIAAAGGNPGDIVRLTWYVTDKRAYDAAATAIGAEYRAIIGDHYPAMTLVEVASLLQDRALVEIEATAVLSEGRS
jgi:enamine deaminase RidA (YjgF/YER057c/UK114 family)